MGEQSFLVASKNECSFPHKKMRLQGWFHDSTDQKVTTGYVMSELIPTRIYRVKRK
jgi:hypothetical protein